MTEAEHRAAETWGFMLLNPDPSIVPLWIDRVQDVVGDRVMAKGHLFDAGRKRLEDELPEVDRQLFEWKGVIRDLTNSPGGGVADVRPHQTEGWERRRERWWAVDGDRGTGGSGVRSG